MAKGRKALPDAVKRLRGTDEKRRMRGEGLQTEKVTSTELAMSGVGYNSLSTDRARSIFTDKCNQLISLNILAPQDLDQLSIYADALDKFYICIEELDKGMFKEVYDENGNIIRFISNPYLKLYKDLVVIINRIGSDFGMSPVSRMKIKAEPDKPLSPIEELKRMASKK